MDQVAMQTVGVLCRGKNASLWPVGRKALQIIEMWRTGLVEEYLVFARQVLGNVPGGMPASERTVDPFARKASAEVLPEPCGPVTSAHLYLGGIRSR